MSDGIGTPGTGSEAAFAVGSFSATREELRDGEPVSTPFRFGFEMALRRPGLGSGSAARETTPRPWARLSRVLIALKRARGASLVRPRAMAGDSGPHSRVSSFPPRRPTPHYLFLRKSRHSLTPPISAPSPAATQAQPGSRPSLSSPPPTSPPPAPDLRPHPHPQRQRQGQANSIGAPPRLRYSLSRSLLPLLRLWLRLRGLVRQERSGLIPKREGVRLGARRRD